MNIKHYAAAIAVLLGANNIMAQDAVRAKQPANVPQTTTITSPDGQTFVTVAMKDGRMTYTAGLLAQRKVKKNTVTDTITLLEPSPLGLITNMGDWSRDLFLRDVKIDDVEDNYTLRQAKQSKVSYKARRARFAVVAPGKKAYTIEMQVSDNNLAYRYDIPMQGETACVVVNGEASGFDFPQETTTFICPQSDPMIGWKRTKPSYEEEYQADEPIGTPSKYGHGYTFPCLFHVNKPVVTSGSPNTQLPNSKSSNGKLSNGQSSNGQSYWVLLSETGLRGDYCGCHISDGTKDGLYTIAFPMEGENNGFGSTGAQFGLPGTTPWRTVTMGATLKPIVETTISWDVVKPLYDSKYPIEGGRSSWSWIMWQDPGVNYDDFKTYIDLAADMKWEYSLLDGGWVETVGRERMEELFAYARTKNVAPFVWYNSNGGWNDAPQSAKQCMANPVERKKEMAWLQRHGVKGIKVDFFAGDKQETIKLYEQILSDANDYGIQVIFHGCTLPRGWERMYPNYCSSEAVLASENLIFSQHMDDMEAFNASLHPFCRNATASMEFGGTLLNRRHNRDNNGGQTRRTGDVFQLATAVLFQSSVQNFGLAPNNLKEQPKWEIEFMQNVPATWDEVQLLDGYPTRYIALARRHGDKWYIAAVNAQEQAQEFNLSLPMFTPGQEVTLMLDTDPMTPTMQTVKVDKKGCVRFTVPKDCGAVIL